MRTHGTLAKWNADRGFGFITPAKGPPDVFVHISEFPRGGGRPTIGEMISFEVVPGTDGKQRAVRVMRRGQKPARVPVTRVPKQPPGRWFSRAASLLIIAALGWTGYTHFTKKADAALITVEEEPEYFALVEEPVLPAEPMRLPMAAEPSAPLPEYIPRPAPISTYACDGRTMCSQMRSCEEATFFINNCPNTKMDGNEDGVPCESQWCSF